MSRYILVTLLLMLLVMLLVNKMIRILKNKLDIQSVPSLRTVIKI